MQEVASAQRWRAPVAPAQRRPVQLHEIVLVGAHGGAGVSTLAALLQPAWDMGAMRGSPDPRFPPVRTAGRPLVLVTRNTVAAAARATAAVAAFTGAGGQIAALIVVADSPLPEPAEASYRLRLLIARVGAIVRMPFIPALRLVDEPAPVNLPRTARRALGEVRHQVYVHATRAQPVRRPS